MRNGQWPNGRRPMAMPNRRKITPRLEGLTTVHTPGSKGSSLSNVYQLQKGILFCLHSSPALYKLLFSLRDTGASTGVGRAEGRAGSVAGRHERLRGAPGAAAARCPLRSRPGSPFLAPGVCLPVCAPASAIVTRVLGSAVSGCAECVGCVCCLSSNSASTICHVSMMISS